MVDKDREVGRQLIGGFYGPFTLSDSIGDCVNYGLGHIAKKSTNC